MEETPEVAEKQPQSETGLAVIGEAGAAIDMTEAAAMLKDMEPGRELTSEYYTFEPGVEERIIVVGTKKMDALDNSGETVNAIAFVREDGRTYINADVVIRSTLLEYAELAKNGKPVPVAVTQLEETTSGNNKAWKYRNYDVRALR